MGLAISYMFNSSLDTDLGAWAARLDNGETGIAVDVHNVYK